jgi:hypothetical protein
MSGRPGRPCGECGSDSLHTHLALTPAPAEDRDRLRELTFKIHAAWSSNRSRTVEDIEPLLSAFADEVRLEGVKEWKHWHAGEVARLREERDDLQFRVSVLVSENDRICGLLAAAQRQVEELRGELAIVDDRLARRPALDHLRDRLAKIERCISAAAVTDPNDEIGKLQRRVSDLERERDERKERVEALEKVLRETLACAKALIEDEYIPGRPDLYEAQFPWVLRAETALAQGTEPRPETNPLRILCSCGHSIVHHEARAGICTLHCACVQYQGTEPKPEPKA